MRYWYGAMATNPVIECFDPYGSSKKFICLVQIPMPQVFPKTGNRVSNPPVCLLICGGNCRAGRGCDREFLLIVRELPAPVKFSFQPSYCHFAKFLNKWLTSKALQINAKWKKLGAFSF